MPNRVPTATSTITPAFYYRQGSTPTPTSTITPTPIPTLTPTPRPTISVDQGADAVDHGSSLNDIYNGVVKQEPPSLGPDTFVLPMYLQWSRDFGKGYSPTQGMARQALAVFEGVIVTSGAIGTGLAVFTASGNIATAPISFGLGVGAGFVAYRILQSNVDQLNQNILYPAIDNMH